MPRKPSKNEELGKKWNFYVNEQERLEFILTLTKSGYSRAQGAALRAMIHLYISDEEFRNKVNNIIEDYLVYKANGDTSIL